MTIKDSSPILKTDVLLDQLASHAWFSTVDLKSGYWQIRINPKIEEKQHFQLKNGFCSFKLCISNYVMLRKNSRG